MLRQFNSNLGTTSDARAGIGTGMNRMHVYSLVDSPRTIYEGKAWQLAPFWGSRIHRSPDFRFEHERPASYGVDRVYLT